MKSQRPFTGGVHSHLSVSNCHPTSHLRLQTGLTSQRHEQSFWSKYWPLLQGTSLHFANPGYSGVHSQVSGSRKSLGSHSTLQGGLGKNGEHVQVVGSKYHLSSHFISHFSYISSYFKHSQVFWSKIVPPGHLLVQTGLAFSHWQEWISNTSPMGQAFNEQMLSGCTHLHLSKSQK